MEAEKTSVDGMGASIDEGRLSAEKTLTGSVSKSLRMKGLASPASIRMGPDGE
jgi:hypothetical protein